MKQIFVLFITVFGLASCSYTSGSGNIITENRSVKDFTGISVGGNFDVEVKIGPATEVKVEADDNIMRYIETVVSGNTLKIRTKDLHNYGDVHMKVYITTPSLVKINASASARVDVKDEIKSTEKISFNASSSGNIHADVDAPDVEADASSGAGLNLTGKTRTYNAQASSGGSIKSFDLLSENTIVQVSSGASARVHASISLNAQASSGGTVRYHGDAAVTKTESSGGSINKKD